MQQVGIGVSLDASAFPGARPKEVERALDKECPGVYLKWNTGGHWEAWHKDRWGRPYKFYIHSYYDGSFRPADDHLIYFVRERALFTEYAGQRQRRMQDLAGNAQMPQKDADYERWKIRQRMKT
jgi:hypothetical protein